MIDLAKPHWQSLAANPSRAITIDAHDMVILCDTSISMSERHSGCNLPRIEILRRSLRRIMPRLIKPTLIQFNDTASEIRSEDYLIPNGCTQVAPALLAARLMNPARIIVITDGAPTDSHADSLAIARSMVARIDVYYCGEASDFAAIAFCQALVQRGGELIINPLSEGSLADLVTKPLLLQDRHA